MKKTILPIVLATIWISLSEFFRNEFLLKHHWISHYEGMGLDFPDTPVNGAIWGIWSLLFALALFVLHKKFSIRDTILLGWLMAFVMMWVVTGNLDVLPFRILFVAIPLSILETFVAAWIIQRLT